MHTFLLLYEAFFVLNQQMLKLLSITKIIILHYTCHKILQGFLLIVGPQLILLL